ncbi:MAG: Gfo/Idh/MocA family oxidoreductase [Bacteroidota bacterium]
MNKELDSRRDFIKKAALGTAGIAVGPVAFGNPNIYGANDRLNFAVAGVVSRGNAHIGAIGSVDNARITHVIDVDSRAALKAAEKIKKSGAKKPKIAEDFRKVLEDKNVDAITIATPDHWHAPMAIMALKAGKHVYVEKPCCHNPAEGELLVAAQKKYGLQVQMGNQQRSGAISIQAMKDIKDGIIGDVYFGKAWYNNKRGSIGTGKEAAVPEWLNWDLWQGPAPRTPYRDNLVHYNWHWFWRWGTGEINNNGTHELDICRWALGVDYPSKVTSSGGRYHFQDDWEFYDTQVANFEFEGGKMITWEGKSCNNQPYFDRGRGATISGTKGYIMLDRNAYFAYDNGGKLIKEMREKEQSATTNTVGRGSLDDRHMNNFANGIRNGEALRAPIWDGYISNLLPHLGNMAQECGGMINCNPANGQVIGNKKASGMWSREYEPGWEPSI